MTSTIWHQIWTVMRWDLRGLIRSPLTVGFLIAMPLLAYPGLLWSLEESVPAKTSATKEADEPWTVAAPPDFEAWILPDDRLRWVDEGAASEADVEVTLPTDQEPAVIRYRMNKNRSERARDRVLDVLKRRQQQERIQLFKEAGLEILPKEVLQVETNDLADKAQKAGTSFGRMLTFTLVFLIALCSYPAALHLITAERERGTLETLLVSRVTRNAITSAKFLLVLATTATVSTLALLSLGVCLATGWFSLPGTDTADLSIVSVVLLFLLSVPIMVQLSAGMVALAVKAPSIKSGQFLSAPMFLVVALPASIPLIPEVELSAVLACVPITNVALTVVELWSTTPNWGLVGLALVATAAHTMAALWIGRDAMDGEAAILGPPTLASRHAKNQYGIEALGTFVIAMLLLWFFGMPAQALDFVFGLILTEVVILAGLAVAIVAWLGLSHKEVMQLQLPSNPDLALAVVAGLTAPCMGHLVFALLSTSVAMPEQVVADWQEQFTTLDFPLWAMVGLIALLPAVCEELLFRGALLGLLRASLRPVPCCVIVATMFGLMHFDLLPRILTTGVLGLVVTASAMRSRSLLVPVVIHLLNNTVTVVALSKGLLEPIPANLTALGLGSLLCVIAVAAMGRRGRQPQASPPQMANQ